MGDLRRDSGYAVMGTAALLVDRVSRDPHRPILSVMHIGDTARDAIGDDSASGYRAVTVIHFDPVIILDTDRCGILLIQPDGLPAAKQLRHLHGLGKHRMDAPFLMRCHIT